MFFILPIGVDYQTRRYPVVTFTIIGICTLAYLIQLICRIAIGPEVTMWVLDNLWFTPAECLWWTHITWMFVHEGFFHLLGNMIYLFLFGACVEDLIGRPRFVAVYLLTGFISELAHVASMSDHFASPIPLGGASGAVSGCIGAFLVLMAKTKIEFKWVFIFFLRFFNGEFFLPAWLVISFWFLSDLLEMFLADANAGVAFGAHVGGTLAGLGLMLIQRKFPTQFPEEEDEEPEAPSTPQVLPAFPARTVRVRAHAQPIRIEKPTILLHVDGVQSGPFTHAQLQRMLQNGEVPTHAVYWQEGMESWATVEDLRPPV